MKSLAALRWFAVTITAALISIAVAAVQEEEILQREPLDNYPEALCNDFSPAIYYKSSEVSKSDDWIIFFEGGGGCSSLEECNQRWIDGSNERMVNPLMSSHPYPHTVTGKDLLSSKQKDNPLFYNYTHVLVPYCSQDAFLANRSNPVRTDFRRGFNSTEGADNFVYKGREIFYSVIKDLLRRGMDRAKKIILAGSSAGGIGILNHLEWVQKELNRTSMIQNPPPELFVIIDSSWFITFNGNHAVNWTENVPQIFDLPAPACHDLSLGFSCCTSPACLFTKGYMPNNLPPIFAISSVYDIFTLDVPLKDAFTRFGYNDDQTILRIFNSYGSIMNTTFVQSYSSVSPHLSLFTPSCTQHVYFATSDLWDGDQGGVLNMTVEGEFTSESGLFTLTDPIQSGHWNYVKINRSGIEISLHEALQEWYADPTTPRFYASTCNGPVCGQCLSQISIRLVHDIWVRWVNIAILVLSGLMTLIPLCIKIFGYLYMKYMLYCQRLYAYKIKAGETRNKPHFPRVTYPVSVSCVELNYKIDNTSTQKSGEEQQNSSLEQTLDLPRGQHGLYAFVEVFLPFFKKCYHKCAYRVNPQGYDNLNSSYGSSNLAGRFRQDSGISSSANGRMVGTPISMSCDSLATIDSLDNILEPQSRGIEEARICANGEPQRTSIPNRSSRSHRRKKTILNHINMYVNPGELVAIMGPSGSGKTTLLDVLLGRRTAGDKGGEIFINGLPLSKMREWFIVNTGYVRQLATSFYNELTVRENLLFSMNMQAQRKDSLSTKLKRVEQVIREMGLEEQADIVVGDGIGLGLSGGQRKRLAIAVQLLSMPSILFLDEPTSGLDSASSLEILKSLQEMAGTGRAVVVTIHQPRSEIFHAFDKILLLCKGQVAFFGSPVKVWEFFRKALIMEKELEEDAIQVQDLVLDLLKEKQSQKQVLRSYKDSQEPLKVKNAVMDGRDDTDASSPPAYSRYPGIWHRFVSLESRASLRQNLFTIIYLPIVYTVFGLILGTTYLFTNDALQIMSVTCLLSCSSSLFMSSIIMSLLIEPLKLFALEHSDGIANPHELILQVFIRMSAVCTFPLAVCGTLVFALVYQNYSPNVYFVVLLAFLLVNQVWLAIFIVLTVLAPSQAHRLCPVFAAIGGFCCGFIVPKPLMPPYYRWIFYINPSFYAYSATTVTILESTTLECQRDSELECFRVSGIAILDRFGISDINPVENLVYLIIMVFGFVTIGIIILSLKSNFSVIKESLAETCCLAARRRKKAKVGAVVEDAKEVEATDSDPAILRSFRVRNGHVLSVPTRRRSHQEQQAMLSGSEGFLLDQGRHEVFHDFIRPTERENRYHSTDEDQPEINGGVDFRGSIHFNLPPSRLSSEHSEAHTPGANSEGVQVLTMEEEEDEERRRFRAHKKWNERRRQIEAEFQRLRHFSIQQQRAGRMRHSVSFGDDLEIQVACGAEFVRTGSNGTKTRNFSTTTSGPDSGLPAKTTGAPFALTRNGAPVMHQLERSRSMPVHYPDKEGLAQHQPTLETYAEEDEEEDDDVFDDNILMGLPPKDIPCREMSSSSDQLPDLNMDDIPYTDVHDQNESHPSVSGRRHSQQRGYVSPSANRRGSKGREVPEYVRQVSATELQHGCSQDSSSRRGSKGKRFQVRQELVHFQDDTYPQCASREEGQSSQGSSRKGGFSHDSFV